MSFSSVATRWCLIVAVAALLSVVAAAGGWLALGAPPDESAAPRRASAGKSCVRRLLADWADGRIDHTYPIACYRRAMSSLPTDLEVYSSAPEDIESALRNRILQSRGGSVRRQSP